MKKKNVKKRKKRNVKKKKSAKNEKKVKQYFYILTFKEKSTAATIGSTTNSNAVPGAVVKTGSRVSANITALMANAQQVCTISGPFLIHFRRHLSLLLEK
jgi:hypothetical protein